MEKYEFLLADYDDIPEILDLYRSLTDVSGCAWDSYYPNREIAERDVKESSLYILKDGDKIIAAASAGKESDLDYLQWESKNLCDLERVGVLPEMHNRGIGTIILQNVIEAVKARGFDGIRMLVSKSNPPALALYEKNGFTRCGEAFMYEIDFYCYQTTFNTVL